MKKEVVIAIISGLVIGLIITFGIFTANNALNRQKIKTGNLENNLPASPSNLKNQTKNLQLTAPENFDLINQSEVSISGISWPEAVIAVIAENQTILTQADKEGVFVVKLNLIKGFNEITVIASDDTGYTSTQNLVLTYSTTKIEP